MRVKVYHCSLIPNLQELKPHQCNPKECYRFGLFFAPTLLMALEWRGRLYVERGVDHEHLYSAILDLGKMKIWCDSERGRPRLWDGRVCSALGHQIWVRSTVACQMIDWNKTLEESNVRGITYA